MIGKKIWSKAIKPILLKIFVGIGLLFALFILLLAMMFYCLEWVFRKLYEALDYFEVLRAFMRVERLFYLYSELMKLVKLFLLSFLVSFVTTLKAGVEPEVVASIEGEKEVVQ